MAINGLRYAAGAYATTSDLASNAGLNLVAVSTFSAVSSVSVNNCFTTSYDNYRIVITCTAATTADFGTTLRLRVSGTDNSSSNYAWSGVYATSGASGTEGGGTGQSSFKTGAGYNTGLITVVDVLNPFASNYTSYLESGVRPNEAGIRTHGGSFNATTSFDGFTFAPASGTVTGTVRVYGYKNSI
jgi:hypothetical protein